MFDLKGKKALVTGSTQGIGYAIARAFAEAGAEVYVHCSRDLQKAQKIAKEIGAMAAVLGGKVDRIILTGGIAYGKETVEAIRQKVEWIAPITVYPGEDELLALTQGALRVLKGEEKLMEY